MRFVVLAMLCACGTDSVSSGAPVNGETGLPCEVVDALATCQGCHARPVADGVPIALQTYEDLTAAYLGSSVAERAVARMLDTVAPMPPAPSAPATATTIGAIEAWIADGMPQGSCSDPFGQPPTCTSGKTWHGEEGPEMDPGRACIACHLSEREGPRFTIAGTVYPTGHEPNNCYGATGDIVVEITGANGATQRLTPNRAGNFFSQLAVQTPYTAKVISNGAERAMVAPQTSGDCNSCHTQNGTMSAPGRIVAP